MLKVGYRIRLSSGRGPGREGVIMRVTGSMLRVRWQTEDETTVIPAPGTLTVLAPAAPTVPPPEEAIAPQSAPTKTAPKTPAAKKTTAPKRTATKKATPPKKTAAKKTAAKKPAAKKPAGRTTAGKQTGKKTAARKTAAKKSAKRATKVGSNTTTSARRSSR